jgi:hypothetical protein
MKLNKGLAYHLYFQSRIVNQAQKQQEAAAGKQTQSSACWFHFISDSVNRFVMLLSSS